MTGTTNTAVTWSVNGITGGNAALGTISTTGVYTAPAILPSPAAVSIRATSQASGTSSPSATVTVISDVVVSITAPAQNAGVELGTQKQITSSITSAGNGASTSVTWAVSGTGCSGSACGTISGTGLFTAPQILPATAGNNITVTATSVADTSKSATLTLHITATFTFTINSPPGNTIDNAKSFQFVATLSPGPNNSQPNTSVTWSVSGAGCPPSQLTACGTIDQAGLYTAPNLAPSPAQVTIDAQSVADPSKHQTVTVTINTVIVVAITPSTLNIEIEAQQMFTANVGGLPPTQQSVTWSISGPGCSNFGNPCGSISNPGPVVGSVAVTYTAPITVLPSGGIGPVTITATSVTDTTKSAGVTPTFFSTIQPNLLPSGATRAVSHRQTFDAVLVRTSTGTAPVNNAVEWRVNGVLGGNSTVGFICQKAADPTACSQISVSGSGPPSAPFEVDYRAPAAVPNPSSVTIEMRSQADTSKFTTAAVNVIANVIVSVSPSTSTLPPSGTQQFTASVTGGFNQFVTWSVAAVAGGRCNEASLVPAIPSGAIRSSNTVTITTTSMHAFAAGQSVTISGVDDTSFNGAFTIATVPTTTSLTYNQSGANAFGNGGTATVGSNTVSITSGKISCGTIDASGTYTAPNAAPAASSPGNQVTITATSVDSPTQSGTGTVTVAAGAFISKILPASITALGTGSTDFTLKVQGTSFVASTRGPGSTIVFNAQNLSTTCASSSVCTATILASSVTSPGDYGVQISNPPSAPQPGLSNLVALKVVDPATQVKNFDNAPTVTLTVGNPKQGCSSDTTPDPTDSACQNIFVVEPTTAGSSTEHYNVNFLGIGGNNTCSLNNTALTITRPASSTQDFDVCVESTSPIAPSVSLADTFTISGPSTADITIVNKQLFAGNSFIIQLTLRVGSASQVGPRTLFIENKNREKTALVGAIEVK